MKNIKEIIVESIDLIGDLKDHEELEKLRDYHEKKMGEFPKKHHLHKAHKAAFKGSDIAYDLNAPTSDNSLYRKQGIRTSIQAHQSSFFAKQAERHEKSGNTHKAKEHAARAHKHYENTELYRN